MPGLHPVKSAAALIGFSESTVKPCVPGFCSVLHLCTRHDLPGFLGGVNWMETGAYLVLRV